MKQKIIFQFTDKTLTVYQWSGAGQVTDSVYYLHNPEDHQRFAETAINWATSIGYILLNLSSEEYHQEQLPHIQGKDRQLMLERKLKKLFPNSDYTHYRFLKREKTGRRDDIYQLSGVTDTVAIEPYVDLINGHQIEIKGVYSTPLIIHNIIKPLKSASQVLVIATGKPGLKLMMARPEGIILVTGPTGSGKTTTLYSLLNYLNDETVNIMTLEDPVEYPISMIRQSSLNSSVKMDFADGIRSLMRQDPDIILVGEMRDLDTASMGFRAAMTGHQVFSTLHTNSALGAFSRLKDIGVESSLIAGNIIGIVAQRLIRKLCMHCRERAEPNDIEKKLFAATGDTPEFVYRAVGCERCGQRGYKGRLGLLEILKMDEELDELVAKNASIGELSKMASAKGFQRLVDDGMARVKLGETTLDELSRVVDFSARLGL